MSLLLSFHHVKIPGLSEKDTFRKSLSIDLIRHVDIITLFGHSRTPGTHDFELIKEGFHVAESAIPQLVFVNNPHKLFVEGQTFQEVLGQHEIHSRGPSGFRRLHSPGREFFGEASLPSNERASYVLSLRFSRSPLWCR